MDSRAVLEYNSSIISDNLRGISLPRRLRYEKNETFLCCPAISALLCPMTAYADNSEDAKALYHQVSETQKSITDMNAFADFKISIGGSILEDTA